MSAYSRLTLFEDIGEQEHVFDLLDEWAMAEDRPLPDLCETESFIRKQIKRISGAVQRLEDKNGVGTSHESEVLRTVDEVLSRCSTSSDLRIFDVERVKSLLLQAQMIADQITHDALVPFAVTGKQFRDRQSELARRGLEKRWGGEDRDQLKHIITNLALVTDELGDYLDPAELWPRLFGDLDEAGMSPDDSHAGDSLKAPADSDYYSYGQGEGIKYGAFRKRIERIRNA